MRAAVVSVGLWLGLLQGAGAQESVPDAPAVAVLEAQMAKAVEEGGIPAAAVAVIRDGELVYTGAAGKADIAAGRAADADSHFRIGSISKTLLAIAILQQVDRGALSLDDEIHRLLPEVPIDNPWQDSEPVRVKHLLEHTAGFDDMHFRNMPATPGLDGTAVMQRFAAEFRVRWKPGQWMSYSNPGYGLLAYLLEKRSGVEATAYIDRHVLAPLGMHATVWTPERIQSSLALGYVDADGEVEPWDDISMPAVGALSSTANDMAKLLHYFVSGGQSVPDLLSAASFARMEHTDTGVAVRAGLRPGYGAGNLASERGGWPLRGHSGGIPGYYANLVYNREAGFGYVLMVNVVSAPGIRPLQTDLVSWAAGGREAPAEEASDHADPAWDGWYYYDNPRNEVLGGFDRLINAGYLHAVDDRYVFTHAVAPESSEFVALAANRLRDPEVRQANGVLSTNEHGQRVLITDDNVFVQGSWASVALPQYGFAASLLLMLSSLLFAPIWAIQALRGKLASSPHWRDRVWPLAASAVFAGVIALVFTLRLSELTAGQPNWRLWGIALGGWVFALLGLIGMLQSMRHWGRPGNRYAQAHALLVSVGVVGLSVWLWKVDLLGIRLWAY